MGLMGLVCIDAVAMEVRYSKKKTSMGCLFL